LCTREFTTPPDSPRGAASTVAATIRMNDLLVGYYPCKIAHEAIVMI
jgi:hypothetical protein